MNVGGEWVKLLPTRELEQEEGRSDTAPYSLIVRAGLMCGIWFKDPRGLIYGNVQFFINWENYYICHNGGMVDMFQEMWSFG